MRHRATLLASGLLACSPAGTNDVGETSIDPSDDSDTDGSEGVESDTDDGSVPDAGSDTCEPWATAWIGGPCGHDEDCDYPDGFCLMEAEGFPCGTCSQPCEQYCPDLEGAPTTFCVDSSDVEVSPVQGLCLSQCDPGLFGGDGCREGYTCVTLPRWMDAGTVEAVCVPDDLAPDGSSCMEELMEIGAVFEPALIEPDHPEGHPELDCVIEDPVYLHPPLNDVSWRYIDSVDEAPVLVACETALAIAKTTDILQELAVDEFQHYGTYNCRVIAGTTEISTHGLGLAIDLYGFTLSDDSWYTVFDDWEDGVAMPVTPAGIWLKSLTDRMFDEGVWNIILTPNYNADHDDHFHVDLTPGTKFYE